MTTVDSAETYLAGQTVSEAQIAAWVEQFHRDGFLFLQNVLPPDWCAELRDDLDRALAANHNNLNMVSKTLELVPAIFQYSEANVRLFDVEPIVSFAEALVAPNCHVVHNNSFITPLNGGGISTWHQDDDAHLLSKDGAPPKNIHMPVLWFTANYYLTDVTERANGGTEVIPGSHLFGARPPRSMEGTQWEDQIVYNLGK